MADNMSDQGRPQNNSPHAYTLPSFSSLSRGAGRVESSATHPRRSSMNEQRLADARHALQQEVAARDDTIVALQDEKSRLQSLCDQLSIKSRATDHELAAMVEDRADLRRVINELSTQVKELTKEKEVLQNQSQSDAAQWRQIMSMSSKLQIQNVEESRRFKEEREVWITERERLIQQITDSERSTSLDCVDSQTDPSIVYSDSSSSRRMLSLSLMSEGQLRQEIGIVRDRCQDLENILSMVLQEMTGIERASTVLRDARRRFNTTSSSSTSLSTNEDRSDRDNKRARA